MLLHHAGQQMGGVLAYVIGLVNQRLPCVAKPDTILAWYQRLTARKFDGSKRRSYTGRPRVDSAIEAP